MSPAKATAGKIIINGSISFAAVIAAIGWVAGHGVDLFDVRYAKAQEVNEYRASQKFLRERDSLIYVEQLNDIRRDMKALIFDCRRRGGCP